MRRSVSHEYRRKLVKQRLGHRRKKSEKHCLFLQQRWDKRDVNNTWKYHKQDGSHAAPSCDNDVRMIVSEDGKANSTSAQQKTQHT